ncbi:MAG: proprotein convertase P-domain-containing protein [Thermoanaerobaculia bacterium]|nr:proprotein convertase P-domain-containing protein [Thermoanaerobaculia bacterium]
MTFHVTDQVEIQREDDGTVRKLRHPTQPYAVGDSTALAATDTEETSLRALADDYLREVMPIYGLESRVAENLDASFASAPEPDAAGRLQYLEEHEVPNQATVAYAQTHMGLPVWQSGFLVKIAGSPPRVVGSQNSMDVAVDIEPPPEDAPYDRGRLDPTRLAQVLGLESADGLRIHGTRRLIYRLDIGDRGNAVATTSGEDKLAVDESMMHVAGPALPVPELPDDLEDGRHYVVVEVLFQLDHATWGDANWGAFVEPRTGAVLRVDSFVGCLHHGQLYVQDPPTRGSNVQPSAPATQLDGFRERVLLEGLNTPVGGAEQELEGEFIRLQDIQLPNVAPPTSPTGQDFDFSVPTDDFAGVNAYFHCDRLFRLMEGMGFDVRQYFDGTTFPVRVDHRFSYRDRFGILRGDVINASAPGNAFRNGSDGFRFALLDIPSQVGIALHWRVVLHEFGHSILWDHVSSPNFRFAHSPGDSLAAILNDPGSRAGDRFLTFPFTPISRRHDRRPQDGWAWGGTFDDPFPVGDRRSGDVAGYDREQILSSTLFRYYRAIGGDHTDPAEQRAAARYAAFLIFSAVGVLSNVSQPRDAEDFAEGLMDADLATTSFEDRAGGASHKVMRWAFEQQGAYQPAGAPSNVRTPGAPPAVDVYLDDGRSGGYEPAGSYLFSTDDVWNRRASDDGTDHQDPETGQQNFLYARVRNRGTTTATGVQVEAFTTREGGDRSFPGTWTATDTPSVSFDDDIEPGTDAVVGPLAWTPGNEGVVTVLISVSAAGDPSNVGTINGPISAALLAHLDNNVAGRAMRVVDGDGNGDGGDGTTVQAVAQPRLPIPDADPAGAVSQLHVSTEGEIQRFGIGVTILHTFIGDLRVTLTSPQGTEAVLFEGQGLDQSEDDLSLALSSDDDPAVQPFVSEPSQGTWSLRVVDRIGIDTGTIDRWSLVLVLDN